MTSTRRAGKAADVAHRLLAGLDHGHDWAAHHSQHGRLPLTVQAAAGRDDALLAEIEASGLLGRGGAGFPTGRKMRTVAAGQRTVVVGNGAEGEPASAKDTLLLTRAPHLVLDGLLVAARAVGAREAHLVVHRGSAAVPVLVEALAQRPDATGRIRLHELPDRYVASEESALVAWLNGADAKPTFTPPRPFERGVDGRPTLVNNVETLAHVALIARYGAPWFRSVGDADEPGTLLVTVPGGVLEVPTGTTIGRALERAGCRLQDQQAVLVGGYFGTWLPIVEAWDLPLTHVALRAAGGALGAGVVIPLPREACGVRVTARLAAYLAGQNAGQCGPCFNGLPAIAGAVTALARGDRDGALIPALDRWLTVVPGRGACRHPDGATRLVASALAVFAEDLHAHRRSASCAYAGDSCEDLFPTPSALPTPSFTSAWR